MVSLHAPSKGALIGFAVLVLAIGLGVAYAPEIKAGIRKITKRG